MEVPGPSPCYPLHGWLAAVVNADARRFRIADPELASTVVAAGGTLSDACPDVEIGPAAEIAGDAEQALVPLASEQAEGGARLLRAVRRSIRTTSVRAHAVSTRRRLRLRGYRLVRTVLWDLEQRIRLEGGRTAGANSLAERLPQRAIVMGARREGSATALEAAAAAAGRDVAERVGRSWPLVRAGLLVVIAGDAVLRVAIGPGAQKIARQQRALELLQADGPSPPVADRIPWMIDRGRAGLADWSLERRVRGHRSAPVLDPVLLDDCVDFLVELHSTGGSGHVGASLTDCASFVAEHCPGQDGEALVRACGPRLDEELAPLPRGFGHGDFWSGNLLVERGRLVGVIDWDSAGPGRLPLTDVLHLRLGEIRHRRRQSLGEALVDHLLPWARAGGDSSIRSYSARIGFTVDPARLEALVLAYWLTHVAYELRTFADRPKRPNWLHSNITVLLPTLRERERPSPERIRSR